MKTFPLILAAFTASLAAAQDAKTPAAPPTAPAATTPTAPPATAPTTTSTPGTATTDPKSTDPRSGSGRDSRSRGSRNPPVDSKSGSGKSGSSPSKSGSASPAEGFAAFRPIADKNIFNPNRNGRPQQTEQPVRRSPKVESFALVGTMSYEKGDFAFFESENSAYRKTAKPGDVIAGHKLTAIATDQVKLLKDEKEVELKVGYQLRREDEGAWLASLRPVPEEPYRSPYLSSGSSSFGSSSFGSSGDIDLIRRMMEARMQGGGFDRSRFGGGSFGSSSGSNSAADSAQRRIREQDRDGDGRVSQQEADRGLRDRFREIDKDGNGFVDAAEYTAYYTARYGGGSSGNSTFGGGGSGPSQSPSSPPPPASTTPPANESEILKRLMERRQQENKQ